MNDTKNMIGKFAEHKNAKIEVQQSRERLNSIFQGAGDSMRVIDMNYNIIMVNQEMEKLTGVAAEQSLGKKCYDLFRGRLCHTEECTLKRIMAGEKRLHLEITKEKKCGQKIPVEMVSTPLLSEGRVTGLIESFRDITERRQAEEDLKRRTAELEAANAELEAFSYSVSHDLRAPLRSMDGFAQALLEDYALLLDAKGQDYLNRVRHASQYMAQLIDDLLKLSRVTRSEIKYEKVDLSLLAQACAAELKESDPNRGVEFVIQEGIVVDGDANLLRMVLNNLFDNAWKFSSKNVSARIEFYRLIQDGVKIYCVRDNGVGFDAEYMDKLFTPFQRLHSVEDYSGTGIGLATVRRIINRHGGRVWAESNDFAGAAFYFSL